AIESDARFGCQFHGRFPVQRQVDRRFRNLVIQPDHAVETPGQATFIGILVPVVSQAASETLVPLQSFNINKVDRLVYLIQPQQFDNGKASVPLKVQYPVYSVPVGEKMLISNPVCDAETSTYRPRVGTFLSCGTLIGYSRKD